MADDGAPYEKAIEQTAKTTGKALDFIRDGAHAVSRPIANVYGLLIGDHIEASRERNLDAIARKTKKILADRNLETTVPIPEQIAIPLLEFARGETRDEMQDLWARLLANTMDPARRDDVRPEFVRALERFHPIDALILEKMAEEPQYSQTRTLAERLKVRESSLIVSLANLVSEKCVRTMKTPQLSDEPYYAIAGFGLELLLACRP